jgi:hypothetical protein
MEFVIESKKHGSFVVYYDDEDHGLLKDYHWVIAKGRSRIKIFWRVCIFK